MDAPFKEEIKKEIKLSPMFKHMQTLLPEEIEKGVESRLFCQPWVHLLARGNKKGHFNIGTLKG